MKPGARLFPLQPLLRLTGCTPRQLSERTHANGTTVARAVREGCTVSEADRWACRLGWHPLEVWGDMWLTADHEAERQPAA